jgi:hypothetical protein
MAAIAARQLTKAAGVDVNEGGEGGGGYSVEVSVQGTRLEALKDGGDVTGREGAHEVAEARPHTEAQEHVELISVAHTARCGDQERAQATQEAECTRLVALHKCADISG